MLKEFDEEQAGVRDEWQKLAATMQTKRGGVAVEMKPPEAVAPPPVEELVAPPPPVEEVGEEEVGETHAVKDMVFEYVASHPDGVNVPDLEEDFGLGRKKVEKTLKRLVKDGKVEERDDLYFAM